MEGAVFDLPMALKPLNGAIRMSQYQKGQTNLDLLEQESDRCRFAYRTKYM